MNNNNLNVNIDLSKTVSVETPSGGKIWSQGVILRKLSRFVIGADEDALIPIPVFYDVESGEILTGMLPKELREEYGITNI
jgi:hypothetical protein